MNLIFGVIISTFAELRDQKAFIDNEVQNICSICSLDRNLFEKNSKAFENHLNYEHSVFAYIYFMYGIKRKDDTEYNGMESFVDSEIKKESVDWIPVQRSLAIFDGMEQLIGDDEPVNQLNATTMEKFDKVMETIQEIQNAIEEDKTHKLNKNLKS